MSVYHLLLTEGKDCSTQVGLTYTSIDDTKSCMLIAFESKRTKIIVQMVMYHDQQCAKHLNQREGKRSIIIQNNTRTKIINNPTYEKKNYPTRSSLPCGPPLVV